MLFFLFPAGRAQAKQFIMPDIKSQFQNQKTTTNTQVTIQADTVSFSPQDNKAHAVGNVVVVTKDKKQLYCDTLDMDRTIKQAVAQGHVYLDTPQERVVAEGLTYNFGDGTGEFRNARIWLDPYQVKGQTLDKLSENYMVIHEGYLSTCDFDEPHWRVGAHRMNIYQHDRAVMHGMKLYLGKVPIMYMPYYVQDLKNRPIFTFIPGDKKDFGLFLLTTARFNVGPRMKFVVHGDFREREGLGEGFDINYNTPHYGRGLISTYYMAENKIAGHHLWNEYNRQGDKKGPTTVHERFRLIWRHHWLVDPNTSMILQYYKVHDFDIANNGFLKTYFPREYSQASQNNYFDSYFFLTHNMRFGTVSFNVDTVRVNRAYRGDTAPGTIPKVGVERIPEVSYGLNNTQIGKSGFYFKTTDVYSDLTYQNFPKTHIEKTQRFDSNNDINHPMKLGFISVNPHLGGEETYYSRTAEINDNNVYRGIFRGSVDVSTKFYRVWDYETDFAGLDIHRLRHVITPTMTYLYQAMPTFKPVNLNQFDDTDSEGRVHQFQLGLENKLQTKRGGSEVDLIRFLISTKFSLKGPPLPYRRGFLPYDTQLDINPTNWLSLHNDNEYDSKLGVLNNENFDIEVRGDGWAASVGNRYALDQGDQVTGELQYRLNSKWAFRVYGTFPLMRAANGNATSARGYEYDIIRDLHEWTMEVTITTHQSQGSSIYVIFRLKAFPNMKLNLYNSLFHASRPAPIQDINQSGEAIQTTGAT